MPYGEPRFSSARFPVCYATTYDRSNHGGAWITHMSKKKTKARPIAVIDAETDPFKYGRVPEPFLWGFYNGLEFLHWETREEMMAYLSDKEYIVYAHNGGRFDWHYLKGFIPVPSEIMLINGRISKFTIGRCEFRDSFNMVPVALKAYDKDTINYEIMEKEVRKLPKNWALIIFTISILFVFGWFSRDLEVTALLGDSFAAINALFSSLAFGGMFEDHVVPLKLTPEFATKTLVAYTNDMLIEVNRLFDPISRNELTDHD